MNVKVLAIDPGYRTGCKVAVLDETGKMLDYKTIYPTEPKNDIEGSQKTLKMLIEKYDVDIVSIGNGTGSRERRKSSPIYSKPWRSKSTTPSSVKRALLYTARPSWQPRNIRIWMFLLEVRSPSVEDCRIL